MNTNSIRVNQIRTTKAFTLIELVLVITIIGIISAYALPRFANLKDEADLAQAQGIAGALKAGISLVKATFDSQGNSVRVQNLARFGDGTIDTNNMGYPIGTNKGNGNENIGIGSFGCVGVWNGVLISAPTVAHDNNNQQYRSYRHTDNKVCSYVYRGGGDTRGRNTAALVIKYDSRNGEVVVCGQRSDLPNCN